MKKIVIKIEGTEELKAHIMRIEELFKQIRFEVLRLETNPLNVNLEEEDV